MLNIYITAWQKNTIKKKSIESCIAMAVALGLQFIIILFDRTTQGYINLFVFWPLVIFASIQVIGVTVYYIKHFKSASLVYFLMTIPVYAFWGYVLLTMIGRY